MGQATELSVHKAITVQTSRDRAFEVFAEQMGSWWPFASKSIGIAEPETAVVEPRAGGRWFERGVDGSECEWGRVIAYEPPVRLVLDWQIGADWRYDPHLHTTVEVRFIAVTEASTRVELTHSGLAAFGDQAALMRTIFDSPEGWGEIIGAYAADLSA